MPTSAPLLPGVVKRHRVYRGLTERQERIFEEIAFVIIIAFISAWVGAIAHERRIADHVRRTAEASGASPAEAAQAAAPIAPTRQIATSLLASERAPTAVYITDAMLGFLGPLRGESGKLRVVTHTPGSTIIRPAGSAAAVFTRDGAEQVSPEFTAPSRPGVYKLAVQMDRAKRAVDDLSVITLVPFAEKRGGKIGLYYLGSWPYERGGTPRSKAYATPDGFIEVTPENQNTFVSEHFRLRDFLTKDQPNVWPKYLLVNPKMLDKLELIIQELERGGRDIRHVAVMSGFRTPRYNHGGGNTAGRANLSRHMYGDACDIYVDNDRNGNMDDLNGDRLIDARDAEVMGAAAERVERRYPSLVGGVGVYSACCGHGPFTHIDVRGFRARWRGSGNG